MNTAKDIGGGNKVSTPAYSGGVIKNIIILRDEPTIKDAIAAFTWEEIKATTETNFPNYGHAVLSTEEFIQNINS